MKLADKSGATLHDHLISNLQIDENAHLLGSGLGHHY